MAGDLAGAASRSDGVCALRLGLIGRRFLNPQARRVKEHFNAEGAEVFAKERREKLSFAHLCECLSFLCV